MAIQRRCEMPESTARRENHNNGDKPTRLMPQPRPVSVIWDAIPKRYMRRMTKLRKNIFNAKSTPSDRRNGEEEDGKEDAGAVKRR
jgi:hypothetical protein